MTLYAVWKDPVPLGLITGPETFSISEPVLSSSAFWASCSVSEACGFTFESTNSFLQQPVRGNGYVRIYDSNGAEVYTGYRLYDSSGSIRDFAVVVSTPVPYETYYLQQRIAFTHDNPVDTLKLNIQATPQYEENPYGAESVLPASTKTIEAEAFANTAFASLLIPASVERIGEQAFTGRERLSKIIIENPEIEIAEDAFYGSGTESVLTLVAPADSTVFDYCLRHGISFRRLRESSASQ